MTSKNTDDGIFDEKILAKKIAEEEDLLTRLQMELADRQERKKKVASNIRTITHKIKALEEDITKDAISVEKLKKHREKYVIKVDSKVVNKQIDKKVEEMYAGLLQTIDPMEMRIEVEFEGLRTTFTVSDHKINNHYDNRTTQDDTSPKGSFRDGSMQNSIMSMENNYGKKDKKGFLCRTFGEMKSDVAAFFSLSVEDFFFADPQNAIFLDDLPIRPTLFPFGQKIKKTLPRLKIILSHNAKFDDMITAKVREQLGDAEVEDNTLLKAEQREAYDNEQARKKADKRKKEASEYYFYKKRIYKIKGFVSALLYMVLIVLWLYNVFSSFESTETFLMRNATETFFQSYSAVNTKTFYTALTGLMVDSNSTSEAYGAAFYFIASLLIITRLYTF